MTFNQTLKARHLPTVFVVQFPRNTNTKKFPCWLSKNKIICRLLRSHREKHIFAGCKLNGQLREQSAGVPLNFAQRNCIVSCSQRCAFSSYLSRSAKALGVQQPNYAAAFLNAEGPRAKFTF